MNEVASSSTPLITDVPAFEWGEGHTVRFAIADLLTKGQFAAQTIVLIDSGFTQAVYGQHAEKHDQSRIHHMQTLHIRNEKLSDDADLIVAQAYELVKADLIKIFVEQYEALGTAQTLAEAFIEHFPKIVQTKSGVEALAW